MLVKDKGIRGIVIKLDFNTIVQENEVELSVGAGVLLKKLSRIACEKSLKGLEFACGIPGSFGGAIYMNAGVGDEEIGKRIVSTTYIDEKLDIKTINSSEQEFSYRKSIFQKNNWIIISGKISLEKGNKKEIEEKMEQYMETRKSKQPLNMPSAGSVFKRGENYITAKLIDECGLKGYSIGNAQVSDLHAGFIVNKGNATAEDILKLTKYVQEKVKEKFNIEIEPEIKIIGED